MFDANELYGLDKRGEGGDVDINRNFDAVLSTLGEEGYNDGSEHAHEDGRDYVDAWGRIDEGEKEKGEGGNGPLFTMGAGCSMTDVVSTAEKMAKETL